MNYRDDISVIKEMIATDKINRFSKLIDTLHLPEKVIRFYNDILVEIEIMIGYIAQLEIDNFQSYQKLNSEKGARLQMQIYIGMLCYMSNSGKGANVLDALSEEINNYFIKDEEYYKKMIELINDARTSE